MSEREQLLSARLQGLRLESRPAPRPRATCDSDLPLNLNPFSKRRRCKSLSPPVALGTPCVCKRRRSAPLKSLRRKLLLREPVLKLAESPGAEGAAGEDKGKAGEEAAGDKEKLFGGFVENQDFRSVMDGCQHLDLNNDQMLTFPKQTFRDRSASEGARTERQSAQSSCSQQAMARMSVNPPCDVTMDELASYFETFVHIPKKMSSMAEMMYI